MAKIRESVVMIFEDEDGTDVTVAQDGDYLNLENAGKTLCIPIENIPDLIVCLQRIADVAAKENDQ